jgi:hypothetical protein
MSINWLSKAAMVKEIRKYIGYDEVPNLQEDQLEILMDKFIIQELKQAYLITLGKIGVEHYTSVMLSYNSLQRSCHVNIY